MKKALCIIISLMMLIMLSSCSNENKTENETEIRLQQAIEEAEYINENSYFGRVDGIDCSLLSVHDEEAMPDMQYYLDAYAGTYGYYNFNDGVYVTSVCFTSPKLHLLGIRTGDDLNDAQKILTENGYEKKLEVRIRGRLSVLYEKGYAFVRLYVAEDTGYPIIDEINVFLTDPQYDGLVY